MAGSRFLGFLIAQVSGRSPRRLCTLNEHDIPRLNAPAKSELFAVPRPIEAEQGIPVQLRQLVRSAAVQWLAPDVGSFLPALDIRQLTAVRTPADAGRCRSRCRNGHHIPGLSAITADHGYAVRVILSTRWVFRIEPRNPFPVRRNGRLEPQSIVQLHGWPCC